MISTEGETVRLRIATKQIALDRNTFDLIWRAAVGLILFALVMVAFSLKAHAQTPPAKSEVAPTAASSSAPVASDSPRKDETPLTDREKALLERIDQLEKRLGAVEGMVAKPTSTAAANETAKPQTELASDTKPISPAVEPPVAQDQPAKKKYSEHFAWADWSWLTGNARTKDLAADSKFFTPEIRVDVNYTSSFNHPKDNTIGGSSEIFRSGEFVLTQLGLGGDFHYDNVRGRVMTQIGMYSQTQPRNDPSTARGQWQLDNAYRYLSEAYGGMHFDKMHGINVDAGIFLSYIGLWSFYNFDNWTYQPSFVSSNTPWFFTGVRAQIFPSDKLKIEPWFINGWQTYGKFNKAPGIGGQVLWRPNDKLSLVFNNYFGQDTLGNPGRKRF